MYYLIKVGPIEDDEKCAEMKVDWGLESLLPPKYQRGPMPHLFIVGYVGWMAAVREALFYGPDSREIPFLATTTAMLSMGL